MNRCVSIVGRDGVNILGSETRICRITAPDTLRDLFNRVAPEGNLRLVSVKLQQAVATPTKDATHTAEFDEKILDLVNLVVGSQGFDPIVVTFVVAPEPADDNTASGTTPATDVDVDACVGSRLHSVNVVAVPADEILQNCLTRDEVAGWSDDQLRQAQSDFTLLYLKRFSSGFEDGDPRRAVFEAVNAVLQHVTPAFLQTLHFECSPAISELLQFAQTRNLSHATSHWPAKTSAQSSVAQAITHLFSSQAIFSVISRSGWRSVLCHLSALRAATDADLAHALATAVAAPAQSADEDEGVTTPSQGRRCELDSKTLVDSEKRGSFCVGSFCVGSSGHAEFEGRRSVAKEPPCLSEPTMPHAEPPLPVNRASSCPASVPAAKPQRPGPPSKNSGTALPQGSDARGTFRASSRSGSRADGNATSASHYINAVTLKRARSRRSEPRSEANGGGSQQAAPTAQHGQFNTPDSGADHSSGLLQSVAFLVKAQDGTLTHFACTSDDMGETVHSAMAQAAGVSVGGFILLFDGIHLCGHHRVVEVLQDGDVVNMILVRGKSEDSAAFAC